MKNIPEVALRQLYLGSAMSPYDIAKVFECDHKTVRSYLKKYSIPLRTPQEYNYLSKKSHSSPSQQVLLSSLSVAGHVAYLCEGWHTGSTDCLSFCNQDTQLIDLFCQTIVEVYSYTSAPRISIRLNKDCEESVNKARRYQEIYEGAGLANDRSRKNPILVVQAGGRNFSREFISNAYLILSQLTTPATGCTPYRNMTPACP